MTDASSAARVGHHDGVELRPGLSVDDAFLAAFAHAHGIRRIALFGSALRDDFRPDSDIDLLVEFDRPVSLFEFARLRRRLEELLGRPVDMVTREALKPQLRERILNEAVRAA